MKGIKDMDELQEELLAHEEKLANQVRIEDDLLIIDVDYEYAIELSRLDTHPKILAWTAHLCGKTWMTNDVLERFIRVACHAHNLELTQP